MDDVSAVLSVVTTVIMAACGAATSTTLANFLKNHFKLSRPIYSVKFEHGKEERFLIEEKNVTLSLKKNIDSYMEFEKKIGEFLRQSKEVEKFTVNSDKDDTDFSVQKNGNRYGIEIKSFPDLIALSDRRNWTKNYDKVIVISPKSSELKYYSDKSKINIVLEKISGKNNYRGGEELSFHFIEKAKDVEAILTELG